MCEGLSREVPSHLNIDTQPGGNENDKRLVNKADPAIDELCDKSLYANNNIYEKDLAHHYFIAEAKDTNSKNRNPLLKRLIGKHMFTNPLGFRSWHTAYTSKSKRALIEKLEKKDPKTYDESKESWHAFFLRYDFDLDKTL